MPRTSALLALTLAALTRAASNTTYPTYNHYPVPFSGGSAPSGDPQIFVDANNNANDSNTVHFRHQPYSDYPSIYGNWSWTVKVSDVQVPGNSTDTSKLPPNAHVAYTTYDFSWPEDGSLNQALGAEANDSTTGIPPSCAYIFTIQFPGNVSKKFDDANGSNCTSVLGAECVKNLTAAVHLSDDCQTGSFGLLSGPAFEAACGDSFGVAVGNWGTEGFISGNSSVAARNDSDALQKGQTFAYSLSAPYTPDNLTIYDQAKDNVHVMIVASSQTSLLCNRAGNGSSLTSAAVGRGSGLAVTAGVTVAALVALLNVL